MNIANNLLEEIKDGDIVEIQWISPAGYNHENGIEVGSKCVAQLKERKMPSIHDYCGQEFISICNKINKSHCIKFVSLENKNHYIYSCYCKVKKVKNKET